MRETRLIEAAIAIAAMTGSAARAQLPADFVRETVLPPLPAPMAMAFLPDGRLIIAGRHGQMWITDPSDQTPSAQPYLLVADVATDGFKGVWGVAVDPDFAARPAIYAYYAHAPSERFRVARFAHLGDTADPRSGRVIWQDNETFVPGTNHYGGGLTFGPGGLLYLTIGEEFEGQQAQDLTRSGGKIVRIHGEGFIPPDNPFSDGPGGNEDSIWALGLRNPFRAAWDLPARRLFVGDVGASGHEELNLGAAGANYGWPMCEGPCGRFVDPVFSYATSPSAAIVGGAVYRGGRFLSDPYHGAFFFADYMRQYVHYVTFDGGGAANPLEHGFDPSSSRITALAQGPDGALYALQVFTGLARYVYTGPGEPPVVTSSSADPVQGGPPLVVTLTATATDPDGGDVSYHWYLGDGGEADGPRVAHTYEAGGIYRAWVEVADGTHTTLAGPIVIEVGSAPSVQIESPADGALFRGGEEIVLSATASDSDEGIDPEEIQWIVRRFHDGAQTIVLGPANGPGLSFTVPVQGEAFDGDSGYEIAAGVFDSDGLSASDSILIRPDMIALSLASEPPGLSLALDGQVVQAPLTFPTLIGREHALGATTQCVGEQAFAFDHWSDGGAAFHTLVIPERATTVRASFEAGGPASGDVNIDGSTDSLDLVAVVLDWGKCPAPRAAGTCLADLDCDGSVAVTDLLLVILNWSD